MTEHADRAAPDGVPFPWEAEMDSPAEVPAQPGGKRQRHNAFTDARKCVFLRALKKTGCLLDACRVTGVSPKTVYRHQESDRRFAEYCRIALAMSATPLELTAWSRAVEGVEREFACGGQVHVRRIYSDSLLRLLLQGANPKKYGQRPGFTRKRLAKAERKQIEREVRAERAAKEQERRPTFEAAIADLDRYLQAIAAGETEERRAAGWTRTPAGDWLPPGYGWVGPGEEPAPADGPAGGMPPGDSM